MIMVQSKSLELDFGVCDGYTMNVDVLMQMVIIDFKKNMTKTKAQMAMCQCKWQQLTTRKQWASKSEPQGILIPSHRSPPSWRSKVMEPHLKEVLPIGPWMPTLI
jgi:hypothetical protein